jgi:hypothetical protein
VTAHFCLTIRSERAGHTDFPHFTELYTASYKHIVSFLYRTGVPMAWALPAPQLEYFAKHHSEFTDLLSELIAKKQVEMLGSGYYDPVFPLLHSADCVAQIELCSAAQRRLVGRCPTGIGMAGGIWDPCVIVPFNRCGMRYVLLDSSLIQESPIPSPLLVENLGKALAVLPVTSIVDPDNTQSPDEYIHRLERFFADAKSSANPVAVCGLAPDKIVTLIQSGWLETFAIRLAEKLPEIKLTTPSQFLSQPRTYTPAYIPPGMAGKERVGTSGRAVTVRDYLQTDDALRGLYARMLHVRLLIDQCRGDRVRKKAANERLWEAQAGEAYLPSGTAPAAMQHHRELAYRELIQAEKITREATNFTPSVASFDFNLDGSNEYLGRFTPFNVFISKRGGAIFELDIFKSAINYARPIPPRNGGASCSCRCFVDYLVPPALWNRIIGENPEKRDVLIDESSLFHNRHYSEVLFNRIRKEIRLQTTGIFGTLPVSLKKNYFLSDNGIQVQYILTNQGDKKLTACFAVSSAFCPPGNRREERKIELVINTEHQDIPAAARFARPDGVSCVQFTDEPNNVSIILEPNEASGFLLNPGVSEENGNAATVCCVNYWPIELEPGMQMEKTINMTIRTPAKKRKK